MATFSAGYSPRKIKVPPMRYALIDRRGHLFDELPLGVGPQAGWGLDKHDWHREPSR
jgi:hypothetical protein